LIKIVGKFRSIRNTFVGSLELSTVGGTV